MGSVNANFIPASTGLTLGNQNQQWNAFLGLLNGSVPANLSVTPVTWVSTPAFVTTAIFSVLTMTLTGNVGSSTYSGPAGFVVCQFTQDGIGGRTFAWPANFRQPTLVDPAASATTSQIFYYDGANAWPLGPGVVYP